MKKGNFIKSETLNNLYKRFNIVSKPDESIKDVKSNLLNLILYVLNVFGVPIIIIATVEAVKLNQTYAAISYFLFYLPVFAAFIFRKKLHYNLLVFLLLISAYLIGVGNLYIYGFTGANIPIFLTIFVLTTIFYNLKKGLISMIFCVITMLVFAFLFTQNLLILDIALYNLPEKAVSWGAATFTLIFIGSIIMISLGYIQHKMAEKISFSEKQANELEQEIVKQKMSEQALKESEQKLRESNRTKDKFFSIISHDLKSPFNTMFGFSELLVNNFDEYDVQEQKKYLGILNKGIHNTYKLIENLLLWSRAQIGTINFNPEKENLYLLTIETIDLLRQSALDKSITITNKIPEDTIVFAEKNMLSTILRNLISNAIKFTPKNGFVEIGCRVSSVKTDGRLSQQVGNNLRSLQSIQIYVKDNGVGISKEVQSNLFEISENISTKGTEKEEGTGLGLILCKEFVEKHGGKIWVESKVGKGSEFIFTLPENKR
ncbi:MAG: hypothetical protein DRJ07_03465 [Bacteroidetes bacterium]|nr:MAG: hypothetical protein DRJ07_03465 [Bacteroidota bacterium]